MLKQRIAIARDKARRKIRRWMLRSHPPDAQPVRLRQSRVYVFPTPAGIAVTTTLLVMLIASINYNLSLGYALCFVLGGIWVAHILESWRTLVDLEITIHPVGEAFAAGSASFEAAISNHDRRIRRAITFNTDAGLVLFQATIPPHSSSRSRFEIPAPQRGRLPVGQLTVESRQPLGWIRAWSYIEPAAEQIVFPQAFGQQEPPPSPTVHPSGRLHPAMGDDDFAGMRNYHPSDSPRHLAWKAHARGQPLQTKLFTSNQAPEWVLDWSHLPAGMAQETRLSQLTLWVLSARQSGARTTLILPAGFISAGQDAAHHHRCLLRLALYGQGGAE